MSRPNISRDLQAQLRKQEREMKKDIARKPIKSGYKHKEVAERTGLSLGTIARISSSIPKTQKQNKKALI